ncbi:phospholipid carrier-dependent glycosyltransferase [Candidatus Curtissbacteria bacterium]|nr:phospholipid carrier-dependent glycosyltransferase [Candidatus Curtissbacteria bacterium]
MKRILLVVIIFLAAALRLYKLGSVPLSLYWDEASLGYNAYSIYKTAADEHGRFLPGTNFAAFGDYKPPGYIYATVPSVAVFGLNEFAVRFPSAFFGVATVLLTYFLAKKLFEKESLALLTAALLAISPWHIGLSRGAFEGNLALFFSTLGIYFFTKFARDHPLFIYLSAASFLIAVYTFTGQRLFVPVILIVLFIQFRKQVAANIKHVAVAGAIAAFLLWPLFVFTTRTIEGRLRFNEVTIFKDLEPIDRSTRYRGRDDYSPVSSIIHNRRLLYAREYLIHYFDAFNPSFLFTRGDVNPRFSTQEVGQLYLVELPLVLSGIYFLLKTRQNYTFLIVAWLLISPLGPATARETPHALRMVHILPTYQLIAAFGLASLYQVVSMKRIFTILVLGLYSLQFFFYQHIYFHHWAKNYAWEWQYGYKQAIEAIKPLYNEADQIIVTKNLGRPYIYFLLYLAYDPQKYWQTAQIGRDEFYFIDVGAFDKFLFVESPNDAKVSGKTIYVTSPEKTPNFAQRITSIESPDKKTVFEISKAEEQQ